MRLLPASAALLTGIVCHAQTVVRGPYLQTPTDGSIIVMWRTDQETSTSLWYGPHPDSLGLYTAVTNNVRDHVVTIGGLSPYTTYYYAVGTGTTVLAGQDTQHRFRTHPAPGTEQPIRVWAIGDFGKGNAGQIAVKESYMAYPGSADTDVWLWLGDNAYQDGKDHEYQSKVFGLDGFKDVFNWLPFYPSPGNHDYNEVWSQSAFLGIPYSNIPLQNHHGPYFDIVDVPEQGEAGGFPSQLEVFYSFDHGNTHFLSLNSEVYDFLNTSQGIDQMVAWVQQDLSQNDKLFTIAYFHQPPYSKGSHDSDALTEQVMRAMRERVIPALEEFDIDLVVCGHSHVYERSYLLHGHYGYSSSLNTATMIKDASTGSYADGTPYMKDDLPSTPDGTVYVVCGNSGSSHSDPSAGHPVMTYSDLGANAYGSFIMDIYRNRLDGRYLKADGTIGDQFTILKKNLALEGPGDTTICAGQQVSLAVLRMGGSDNLTFQWSPDGGNAQEALLAPDETTTYTVTATDQLTGQTETVEFTVNVAQLPQPVIVHSNDSLIVAPGLAYQWYLNGQAIGGATSHFIESPLPGTYVVEVFSGACSWVSEPFFLGTTGIAGAVGGQLHVFPNPTEGRLTVFVPSPIGGRRLLLFDPNGREVMALPVNSTRMVVDMRALAKGTYQLVLDHPGGERQVSSVVLE